MRKFINFEIFLLALLISSCGQVITAATMVTTSSSYGNTNMSLVGSWKGNDSEFIRSIYVDGTSTLYAAAGYDGIFVFTISKNTNLVKVTNLIITNFPVSDMVVKTISAKKFLFVSFGSYTNM